MISQFGVGEKAVRRAWRAAFIVFVIQMPCLPM
jgi:hypothetical protein